MWQCPLCSLPLHTQLMPNTRSWHCDNNHSFDVAKRGYVNLLPVQFKKSKQPGDDKVMLAARQYFHAQQSYLPLMQAMAAHIVEHNRHEVITLYDAGCGEGTYLHQCASLLTETHQVVGAGSDIAKPAVDLAAKQYKAYQFVVASSVALPIIDGGVNVIMQVFAPGKDEEYHRVLADDGLLVTVNPGPDHLFALKSHLYDAPKRHDLPSESRQGFTLEAQQNLRFPLPLNNEEHAQALLQMTPYYWRLPQDQAQVLPLKLFNDPALLEADFVIQIWRKTAGEAAISEK